MEDPKPNYTPDKAAIVREALWQVALDSYRDEHEDLSEVARALETKAQATVATAGVFVGAVLALTRDRLGHASTLSLSVIVLAIALLALSVMAAGLVLRVQPVEKPPQGIGVEELCKDILPFVADADFANRLVSFKVDQVNQWRSYSTARLLANDRKAERLRWAQLLLLWGVSVAAILAIGSVLSS
jgi:hypothetical protein